MKRRFCYLRSIKLEMHKPLLMFSGLPSYSWVIIGTIFSLKNLSISTKNFKQKITLCMIFIKHNSLKSDIIFIPCFSGSRLFLVQAYNIVERRVKLNNKTPFHRKILIAFADNTGLTIGCDLIRFEYILCFWRIEDSTTT